MPSTRDPSPARRARAQAGFSLIEVLLGGVVLSIALMGHVASTLSGYRLAREEQCRREVLEVARQLVERMRSDDDWGGLYGRLRTLQALASKPGLSGERLEDGRRAWSPGYYYPDFVLPPRLSSLAILVDVPFDPGVPQTLRENLDAPLFGLPADLNGDGQIDGSARHQDYQALPVVVTLRWRPTGEAGRQLRLSTWLRGYR